MGSGARWSKRSVTPAWSFKSLKEVEYSKDYDVGCLVVSLEVVDLKTLDDCVYGWSENAGFGIWTLQFVL